jgi:N-acetylglucosamine-6-phosphate deacetylase
MTMKALTGARILSADGWRDRHELLIEAGQIVDIVAEGDAPAETVPLVLDGGMLLPGFIDTQVNGGGGVLLNGTPTVEGVAVIANAHRRFGTTAMLPTLISDTMDVVATAIAAVDAAIRAGVPGVVGIHIEGPFLNEGKRGIHDAAKFRTLDAAAIALLSSLKLGKTLVTLAPEYAPAGAIAELVKRGIIVAAGHTLATYDQMLAAEREGLSGVTHLFNAMSQLESRAPGVVGAAMQGDLSCGVIVDGHHVHPATLRAAFRSIGSQRLMLVTDAMPTVGASAESFTLNGQVIVARGGACYAPDGTLAGSDLNMTQALQNAVAMMAVDVATASQMASSTPATFLGLSGTHGALSAGMRADIVHLSDALKPLSTWIAGEAE